MSADSLRVVADLLDAHATDRRDEPARLLAGLRRRELADVAELLALRYAEALTAGFYAEAEGAPDRVADVYARARMRDETALLRHAAALPDRKVTR